MCESLGAVKMTTSRDWSTSILRLTRFRRVQSRGIVQILELISIIHTFGEKAIAESATSFKKWLVVESRVSVEKQENLLQA